MDKLFSKPIIDSSDISDEEILETGELDLNIENINNSFKETKPFDTVKEEVETDPLDPDRIFSTEAVISTDDIEVYGQSYETEQPEETDEEIADGLFTEEPVQKPENYKKETPKQENEGKTYPQTTVSKKKNYSRYIIIGLIAIIIVCCLAWFVIAMNSGNSNTQTPTQTTEEETPTPVTPPITPPQDSEDTSDEGGDYTYNNNYDSYDNSGNSSSGSSSNQRPSSGGEYSSPSTGTDLGPQESYDEYTQETETEEVPDTSGNETQSPSEDTDVYEQPVEDYTDQGTGNDVSEEQTPQNQVTEEEAEAAPTEYFYE